MKRANRELRSDPRKDDERIPHQSQDETGVVSASVASSWAAYDHDECIRRRPTADLARNPKDNSCAPISMRLEAALAFATWVDAVDALAAFEAPMTLEQTAAAAGLGLEIASSTPKVVATALLHELVDKLSGRDPRSVTDAQKDLMEDLAEFVHDGENPDQFGYDVAYAWVAILLRRRARQSLSELCIESGDLVSRCINSVAVG